MKTDPIKRALALRNTLVSGERILVADFSNTLQGKDTSKVIDLMPIVGTQHYPFRTKVNVKALDPLASEIYNTPFYHISTKTDADIESFLRKQEFDFSLWYKHDAGFNMRKVNHYNLPFILQVAGCNFHDGSQRGGCWYCFVDDKSNDGKPDSGKVYLSINETLESMLDARKRIQGIYHKINHDMDIKVLRVSGGEPTIVLDWILNLWRAIGKSGYDLVGQMDSNLSTARLVDYFEREGVFEANILEKLAEYPVKVLTALKGVDEHNLQSNVQSEATLADQESSLKRIIKAGFDIYPQLYNPNPGPLWHYLERMDSIIKNFSLRIHIGPLKIYGPTTQRLSLEAKRCGKDATAFINEKKTEWDENYKHGCEVIDKYLRVRYGVGYKETTRSDITLSLE